LNLLDLGFIQAKKDIILIGNPGTGKTWLSKCIAYAATQNGVKTLFITAMQCHKVNEIEKNTCKYS
jgi:DNA replication protein DnaC